MLVSTNVEEQTRKGPTNKVPWVVSPPQSIGILGSCGSAANTTQETRWTKPRAIIWGLNPVYNPAVCDPCRLRGCAPKGSGERVPNGASLKVSFPREFQLEPNVLVWPTLFWIMEVALSLHWVSTCSAACDSGGIEFGPREVLSG